jgi:hypothetical protein
MRLRIRAVNHMVLVGWDVEKIVPLIGWTPAADDRGLHHAMDNDDLWADRVDNGKVVKPG